MCSLNSSSEQFPEAGAVIVSILQMGKLRLPEVEILTQDAQYMTGQSAPALWL